MSSKRESSSLGKSLCNKLFYYFDHIISQEYYVILSYVLWYVGIIYQTLCVIFWFPIASWRFERRREVPHHDVRLQLPVLTSLVFRLLSMTPVPHLYFVNQKNNKLIEVLKTRRVIDYDKWSLLYNTCYIYILLKLLQKYTRRTKVYPHVCMFI